MFRGLPLFALSDKSQFLFQLPIYRSLGWQKRVGECPYAFEMTLCGVF